MGLPLRVGKLVGLSLGRILLGTLLLVGFAILAQLATEHFRLEPGSRLGVLIQLSTSLIVCLIYVVMVRLVERRPVRELAPRASHELAPGLGLGFVLFTGTMLAIWSLGCWHFDSFGTTRSVLAPLVSAIGAGFVEELVARGVVFRILEESVGSVIAMAVSAAMFGAMHAGNPGATATSSVAIALEAGVLLAAAYVYTRTLWLPIGLHIGWNFTEGGVWGAAVSGHAGDGWIHGHFSGPDALTGGVFGPEASVLAVLTCLGAAIVLWMRARARGHLVAPRWARSAERRGSSSRIDPPARASET